MNSSKEAAGSRFFVIGAGVNGGSVMDKSYMFTAYNRQMLNAARTLRKNMTPQERRLWHVFLKTYPVKIYRQRSIDRFVVDFYCSAAHLVIELDGAQHFDIQGIAYDAERTAILETYGLKVIRFSNADIDRRFAEVCEQIDRTIKERMI